MQSSKISGEQRNHGGFTGERVMHTDNHTSIVNLVDRDVYPEALPEVTKLKVRQMVQDSIRDYGIVIPRLQQELNDTQAELAAERKLLS